MAVENCCIFLALLMCSCRQLRLSFVLAQFLSVIDFQAVAVHKSCCLKQEGIFLFSVCYVYLSLHYFHSVHRCLRQTVLITPSVSYPGESMSHQLTLHNAAAFLVPHFL